MSAAFQELRSLAEAYRLVLVWPERLLLGALVAILLVWMESRLESGWRARLWRACIALCIGAALARPSLEPGGGLPRIWLVDRSASAAEESLAFLEALPEGEAVLPFGDSRQSPIAEGIELAAAAMPAGGRILLVSDGDATRALPRFDVAARGLEQASADPLSDAIDAASRAAERGVVVDALPLSPEPGPDLALRAIDLPPAIRLGDAAAMRVQVAASRALSGTLRVTAGGRELLRRRLSLDGGDGGVVEIVSLRPREAGLVRLRAEVSLDDGEDALARNDALEAAMHVLSPLAALVVGDGPAAVGFADLLAAEGVAATVLAPERLPGRMSELEAWDALALVDVPASSLGLDQMAALEAFVSDLGRGVLLAGGRQSFLAGAWENSLLEDLAPVRLETPDRAQRDPVALLLLIDQSASMGSVEGRGAISKLALAREAALLAAEVLHPGDRLGVVTYDEGARWLVPMVEVGVGRELAEIESLLSGLATGGGTSILSALELGLSALEEQEGLETRHALLLSDGRDFNTAVGAYVAEVSQARERGVTLSTIAVGSDADQDLLARLARVGRGRFHSAADPGDLPRLAVEESEIVRARSEQLGSFRAAPPAGGQHPLLFGTDPAELPPLTGYLALRPRDGARVVLELPGGDPLLTAWNYGLGRVVAWTSDLGEDWSRAWPGDAAGAGLWARSMRYAARSPDAGPPGLIQRSAPGWSELELDVRDEEGRSVDLGQAGLVYTRTRGAGAGAGLGAGPVTGRLPLEQVAPGLYRAALALEMPEAFPATASIEAEGWRASLPLVLASGHAPEDLPRRPRPDWLQAIAAAGGGRLLEIVPGRAELSSVARPRIELWPWLLGLAALLWLGEVLRQMAGAWLRLPPAPWHRTR